MPAVSNPEDTAAAFTAEKVFEAAAEVSRAPVKEIIANTSEGNPSE
jgi:hypothetical protein